MAEPDERLVIADRQGRRPGDDEFHRVHAETPISRRKVHALQSRLKQRPQVPHIPARSAQGELAAHRRTRAMEQEIQATGATRLVAECFAQLRQQSAHGQADRLRLGARTIEGAGEAQRGNGTHRFDSLRHRFFRATYRRVESLKQLLTEAGRKTATRQRQ